MAYLRTIVPACGKVVSSLDVPTNPTTSTLLLININKAAIDRKKESNKR